MKFTLSILFGLVIIHSTANSQVKSDLIKTIRKDFQTINADTTLRRVELDEDEFLENTPDGGGELVGFYKENNLEKIYEWIGLSYGNRTREFYFNHNKLFFVYEKFESFVVNNKTNELDHGKVMTTFEGRYYFNNKKLIEQKISGQRTFEEKNLDLIKELLSEAKDNFELLNRKRSHAD
jgi:hypothetical protein